MLRSVFFCRCVSICVVAGDAVIGLCKIEVNVDTVNSVDTMVLTNNFTPTILMPTRITPQTSTLIDHLYYNKGGGSLKKELSI